jgi:hypothetical protein
LHLSTDEREPRAELQQEALDVIDERLLDLALAADVGRPEEIEQVGVLEDLGSHVGAGRRQRRLEVVQRLAAPQVQSLLDLEGHDWARPPVLHGPARVPEPRLGIGQALEERGVVVPSQLCKRRLHNCPLRPGSRKCPHVLEVPGR